MTRLVGRWDVFCLGEIGGMCVRWRPYCWNRLVIWINFDYTTRGRRPPSKHIWPCYCRLSVCKQRFLGVCWFDCACWIWEWVFSDATVLHIDVRLLHEDLNSLRAKPRWHWNHRSSVQQGSHMTTRAHTHALTQTWTIQSGVFCFRMLGLL